MQKATGFKNDHFVDKRPAENVGKLIVEKSLETENRQKSFNADSRRYEGSC